MRDQSAQIEKLAAKDDIRELVLSYCAAVDRGDMVLLRSLYAEGAKDEHGVNPSGTAAELFELVPEIISGMRALQHNVTNHRIRVNGDEAEGEVYLIAYHSFDGKLGPMIFVTGARYLDRYIRQDGVWKFAHRRCVNEWGHEGPVPTDWQNSSLASALPGGRIGADDPSYGFFRQFRRGERN